MYAIINNIKKHSSGGEELHRAHTHTISFMTQTVSNHIEMFSTENSLSFRIKHC